MELPALNTGRDGHGCGHYINNDDKMVFIAGNHYYLYYYLCFQVYLVTGGIGGGDYLSSTEVLVDGTTAWMSARELPVAMFGLRGVSFDNNIFVTGNFIIQYKYCSYVFS